MIIFGSGGQALSLGAADSRRCEVCEQTRPFSLLLQYRYFHVYYLFRAVVEKQYLLLCDTCNRGWQLDKNQVEARMEKSPIPFMHRFGCLVGLGALLIIGAIMSLTGA